MMLKNHLDIIGRNEPIQRKAKFWQSYVRALKGTDDMRAPDRTSSRPRGIFRPLLSDFPELSSGWPYGKSMYDEPIHAADRISVPGYRYLPVSREIYGYSPRNLYPAPYRPGTLFRLRNPKYTLESNLKRVEESEDIFHLDETISKKRAQVRFQRSVSPSLRLERASSPSLWLERAATPSLELERAATPSRQFERALTPSFEGLPIYTPGVRRPLADFLQPLEETPHSKISREPWWWTYPSLRPHVEQLKALPSHLRDSFLSPVKSTFHWYEHPFRPFGPLPHAFYYYLWRRSVWENKLDEIDTRIRDALYGPIANPVRP